MRKYFTKILLVLLLLAVAWGLYLFGEEEGIESSKQAAINPLEEKNDLSPDFPEHPNFYPPRDWSIELPEINAKSAIIVNFNSKNQEKRVLFQKNKDEVLSIASLTKLMTALVVLENFELDETIKISKDSILTSGDKGGLIRGEELKVEDLLFIMLIESSNDAAMALTQDNDRITLNEFVELMNDQAQLLDLKNTSFVDPAGLSSQNQSTVSELVRLADYTLNFPLIWQILSNSETIIYSLDNKFVHHLINTNTLLGEISFLRGGKTGYTNEAIGCMLTVLDIVNGNPSKSENYLITVVLGSDQREEDTKILLNWAKEAYRW